MGLDFDHYNDLHMLDMSSMMWKMVHGGNNMVTRVGPSKEASFTFTRISESNAVLFGESNLYQEDCWLLNLHKATTESDPTAMWTRGAMQSYGHHHEITL